MIRFRYASEFFLKSSWILSTPYKVTAADVDWNQPSSVAKKIASANFSTGEFNHPAAFQQSITPEGQLLSVLVDPNLEKEFMGAFILGHYSIEFRRSDATDLRTYYVEQRPGDDVWNAFKACNLEMLRPPD